MSNSSLAPVSRGSWDARVGTVGSLFLSLALFATGCAAPGNYSRSAYGTIGGYSLANANPKPASLMVARKIERPLYIVLDASRVKDTWPLETQACATHVDGCERFKLMDVQTFVRRDLKAAMESYFASVEVVEPSQALPNAPHVVADVKIDDIRLNGLVRGRQTYSLIEMTWSFALRLGEEVDYAYSFAGTAASNDTYPTFEAGCATLVENAIPAMLKKWVEEGGIAALR
ncbi:MAG TPA: hypothetical protein DFS52_00555, partial [Myxococcales bacterium]|nr:hypothetical protein [Myxococcales bacterium]